MSRKVVDIPLAVLRVVSDIIAFLHLVHKIIHCRNKLILQVLQHLQEVDMAVMVKSVGGLVGNPN